MEEGTRHWAKKKKTDNFKLQKVMGTRQIAKTNNGKRKKAMGIRQKQTMVKSNGHSDI
jgi:hypothetical protein